MENQEEMKAHFLRSVGDNITAIDRAIADNDSASSDVIRSNVEHLEYLIQKFNLTKAEKTPIEAAIKRGKAALG